MKKLIFILALLLLTAPAWADVVVEPNSEPWEGWYDEGIGFIEGPIEYDANDSELVRAFALEITVTGPNAFIDWCWFEGAYNVAPGSEDGPIAEWVDDNIIIVEFASLYNEDLEEGDVPESIGTLAGISIGADPDSEVCIDIVVDDLRGGIVMEDVTTRDIDNDQVCWTTAEAPIECNEELTEGQLEEWFNWEEPEVWCLPCWTEGDVTGDENLTFGDVIQVFNAVAAQAESGDPNGSSDATMDGLYTFGDVIFVFNQVQAAGGCP